MTDDPLQAPLLQGLSGRSAAERRDLLDAFVEVTESDLAAARRAAAQHQAAEIARLLHRIKGASLLVGARDLARACAPAELANRAHPAGLGPALDAVSQRFDRLRSRVRSITEFS